MSGASATGARPPSPAARLGRSAAIGVAALLATTAVLLLVFRGPGGRAAVLTSLAIAAVVQTLAFLAARAVSPRRVMEVWVGGAAVRLVVLVVYALVALRPLGLPAAPALLSLATFFFVTTLAESRLHLT